MRQAPLRQRVGGKALVENGDRGFDARILQVGIELREVLRHDHALVDQGGGRQGRQIKDRVIALQRLFGAAPSQKQAAIEGGLVDVLGAIDEHLFD